MLPSSAGYIQIAAGAGILPSTSRRISTGDVVAVGVERTNEVVGQAVNVMLLLPASAGGGANYGDGAAGGFDDVAAAAGYIQTAAGAVAS
ncbi:MAG: hypothetical protein KF778_14955 [Rhodocyclaceae bacterium]|nr:hypothetical protein [Rhodocyclaceae bacterium]